MKLKIVWAGTIATEAPGPKRRDDAVLKIKSSIRLRGHNLHAYSTSEHVKRGV